MSQGRDALRLVSGISFKGLITFLRVLSDGGCDGVVKGSVQQAEVIRADGRVQFHRHLGDGLTDVAVAMHDL